MKVVTISLRSCRVNGVEHADAEMKAHYDQGDERDRLAAPKGVLEFVRTQEIVLRRLPAAPAVVADIGGGPGRYAVWLAELGYEVEHRDVMDLHVEQLQMSGHPLVRTAVGDARSLDLPDSSVDAVLLLGPMLTCANGPIGSGLFEKPAASSAIADPFSSPPSRGGPPALTGFCNSVCMSTFQTSCRFFPSPNAPGTSRQSCPAASSATPIGQMIWYTKSPSQAYNLTTSSVSKACRSPART